MAIQTHVRVRPHVSLAGMAWLVMLAVSVLPNALFHELAGEVPGWLKWAKFGVLFSVAALAYAWRDLRPLRNFFILLLSIFVIEEAVTGLRASALWQAWLGGADAPFAASMWGTQLSRLLAALVMIGVLAALGYRRGDFFLRRGQLEAPIEPVRWLGFARPIPWTRFGGLWAVFIGLGLLLFLFLGGRPPASAFARAAPMLPAVLLLAALNAFNEEMTYRATLLASLTTVVGARQALWVAAAFFGIGHYFGVPYGVVGVVMAGFLGWLLGKAMLETRGLFWAWFIHCVQDVLIFAFMAAGSITPGGF